MIFNHVQYLDQAIPLFPNEMPFDRSNRIMIPLPMGGLIHLIVFKYYGIHVI